MQNEKLTAEMVRNMLRMQGRQVDLDKAALILELIKKLANVVVLQYVNEQRL